MDVGISPSLCRSVSVCVCLRWCVRLVCMWCVCVCVCVCMWCVYVRCSVMQRAKEAMKDPKIVSIMQVQGFGFRVQGLG